MIKNKKGNTFDIRSNISLYEDSPFNPLDDDVSKDDIIKNETIKNNLINDDLTDDILPDSNLKKNLIDVKGVNDEHEKIKLILYSYMDKIDGAHEDRLLYKLVRKCRDEENYENIGHF
ncbi:hypothetical protein MKS88_001278 [Plasmodium brasilianum]|nr:hypothetical protein MKS88_001278 [Plasmodium brasilianum]SBS99158.1 hypothetical protein, conserved [Plasmodium malariae]